jgi:hypothetical protein
MREFYIFTYCTLFTLVRYIVGMQSGIGDTRFASQNQMQPRTAAHVHTLHLDYFVTWIPEVEPPIFYWKLVH